MTNLLSPPQRMFVACPALPDKSSLPKHVWSAYSVGGSLVSNKDMGDVLLSARYSTGLQVHKQFNTQHTWRQQKRGVLKAYKQSNPRCRCHLRDSRAARGRPQESNGTTLLLKLEPPGTCRQHYNADEWNSTLTYAINKGSSQPPQILFHDYM